MFYIFHLYRKFLVQTMTKKINICMKDKNSDVEIFRFACWIFHHERRKFSVDKWTGLIFFFLYGIRLLFHRPLVCNLIMIEFPVRSSLLHLCVPQTQINPKIKLALKRKTQNNEFLQFTYYSFPVLIDLFLVLNLLAFLLLFVAWSKNSVCVFFAGLAVDWFTDSYSYFLL